MPRNDLVITGARLIDGTGGPSRDASVSVRGDRIAEVADVAESGKVNAEGARTLDASGLVLAPGFIDVHTHDDFAAIVHPDMAFKVCGGVTTCVVGNCGMGTAPYRAASLLARAFHPDAELPEWEGTSGYLELLESAPPSVNIAVLVGHGSLRLGAMGGDRRPPTSAELDEMRGWLREGLDAGAVGLSTGLVYEPGRHAQTDEIVELAREMNETGGLYATHMRDEGEGLLDSVNEAIEIGERAGVPVQISHHKAAGRESWGKVGESLGLIERARERGLELHADQYPYTAGSTILSAIAQGMRERGGLGRVGAESIVIAAAAGHPEWEGRSLAQLAEDFSVDPVEAAERVLEAVPGTTAIMHSMSEDDVQTVMRHPTTMIGSDGIPTLGGKPHPRLYGTFARVLGHYVRELGLLSLEEGVHRMTGLSARKFRLADRGEIRPGAYADLVLFDPDTILDRGTYEEPNVFPSGVAHVFVNGTAVVRDGEHVGSRPGRPLRRS